jgi:Flp pilus assembly protein TadB
MGVGDQCNSSVDWAFGTNRMASKELFFFFVGWAIQESTGQNEKKLLNWDNKFEILSQISVLTSEGKMLSFVFFMLLKCL